MEKGYSRDEQEERVGRETGKEEMVEYRKW